MKYILIWTTSMCKVFYEHSLITRIKLFLYNTTCSRHSSSPALVKAPLKGAALSLISVAKAKNGQH